MAAEIVRQSVRPERGALPLKPEAPLSRVSAGDPSEDEGVQEAVAAQAELSVHAARGFARSIKPGDDGAAAVRAQHLRGLVDCDAAARVVHVEALAAEVEGRLLDFLQKPRSAEVRVHARAGGFVVAVEHPRKLARGDVHLARKLLQVRSALDQALLNLRREVGALAAAAVRDHPEVAAARGREVGEHRVPGGRLVGESAAAHREEDLRAGVVEDAPAPEGDREHVFHAGELRPCALRHSNAVARRRIFRDLARAVGGAELNRDPGRPLRPHGAVGAEAARGDHDAVGLDAAAPRLRKAHVGKVDARRAAVHHDDRFGASPEAHFDAQGLGVPHERAAVPRDGRADHMSLHGVAPDRVYSDGRLARRRLSQGRHRRDHGLGPRALLPRRPS